MIAKHGEMIGELMTTLKQSPQTGPARSQPELHAAAVLLFRFRQQRGAEAETTVEQIGPCARGFLHGFKVGFPGRKRYGGQQ